MPKPYRVGLFVRSNNAVMQSVGQSEVRLSGP
jgi:hypothetical protein